MCLDVCVYTACLFLFAQETHGGTSRRFESRGVASRASGEDKKEEREKNGQFPTEKDRRAWLIVHEIRGGEQELPG